MLQALRRFKCLQPLYDFRAMLQILPSQLRLRLEVFPAGLVCRLRGTMEALPFLGRIARDSLSRGSPFFLQGLDAFGEDSRLIRAADESLHFLYQLDPLGCDGIILPLLEFDQLVIELLQTAR